MAHTVLQYIYTHLFAMDSLQDRKEHRINSVLIPAHVTQHKPGTSSNGNSNHYSLPIVCVIVIGIRVQVVSNNTAIPEIIDLHVHTCMH